MGVELGYTAELTQFLLNAIPTDSIAQKVDHELATLQTRER